VPRVKNLLQPDIEWAKVVKEAKVKVQ